MGKKLLAAFIGGLAIIALIFIGGLLGGEAFTVGICVVGVLFGGALAVYIYSRMSPNPVRLGEGAMLGALAGFVGSLPFLIMILIILVMKSAEMQTIIEEQLQQQGQSLSKLPTHGFEIMLAVGGTILSFVMILLALVGGLIGVAIFEKRKPDAGAPPMPPQPPPPPDFGGPAGGGGYGPGNYGGNS